MKTVNKYRQFCLLVVAFVAALLLFNGYVWHFHTKRILAAGNMAKAGDLARLGYLPGYAQERETEFTLPRRHIDVREHQGGTVDMVTIGDSFSNFAGAGKNKYYQDYIATLNGLDVLNIPILPQAENFYETIVILLNSGYLEQLAPDYVLIERVERRCVHKKDLAVDFTKTERLDSVEEWFRRGGTEENVADDVGMQTSTGFFNSGNLKFVLYQMGYRFSANSFVSKTYKVPLNDKLFSGAHGDTLLFYDSDIETLDKSEKVAVGQLNENLNRLADHLADKGIKLCFMPAPNKYTLYARYIRNNPYPESRFFELLRPLDKRYLFIDTDEILSRRLAGGEKDLYYIDDTHWSWKASEAIFEAVRFD